MRDREMMDAEVAELTAERERMLQRMAYLRQPVREAREHPEIVQRLARVREHLPHVSRTAPEGLTSMYDHLRGVEKRLMQRPAEVLAEELAQAEAEAAQVEARLREVQADANLSRDTR
jgi:hypothetical protein